MPDGVMQWYDVDSGDAAVVRSGRVFPARTADVEPAARKAGARVHFDIRRELGVERAVDVRLRQGTRVVHRHRRFGTLQGARRPDTKGAAPFGRPHPDLGRSLAAHPLEVVRAWADAIARGERDEALSLYAPDAVLHLAGGDVDGRRQLDAWLEQHPALARGERADVRGRGTELEVRWQPTESGAPAEGARCRVEHGLIAEQWPLEAEGGPAILTVESGAGPLRIETVVQGDVPEEAIAYAHERIGQLAEYVAEPILFARVKLTRANDPARVRPALVQASLDVNGEAVRGHVAAGSMLEAIDLLHGRLRDLIQHRAEEREALRRWSGKADVGEWRHGDLARQPLEYFDRPVEERELVRLKAFATEEITPDEAIFDMEQLGYDFYLFCDLASGTDSVVERGADGQFLLTRLDASKADLGPNAYPVRTSTTVPPTLQVNEAIERLNVGGEPFVFFDNAATHRGNICYRRYDGHYGLIAPD